MEAKSDGLKKVKLIEAVRDKDNKEHVWCSSYGEVMERSECKKSFCDHYSPNKSGRGTCENRGKLYMHGEEVEFDVK